MKHEVSACTSAGRRSSKRKEIEIKNESEKRQDKRNLFPPKNKTPKKSTSLTPMLVILSGQGEHSFAAATQLMAWHEYALPPLPSRFKLRQTSLQVRRMGLARIW